MSDTLTFCQRMRHTTLDMLSAQSLMRNPKDIPGDGCPPAFCSASCRPPQHTFLLVVPILHT